MIEWNNTRSQWECADKPVSGTEMVWVDSNDVVIGFKGEGDGGSSYRDNYIYVHDSITGRVFGTTYEPSGSCYALEPAIYWTETNCSGTPYIPTELYTRSLVGLALPGPNGFLLAPTGLTVSGISSSLRSYSRVDGYCQHTCSSPEGANFNAQLTEASEINVSNDLGATPPITLQLR